MNQELDQLAPALIAAQAELLHIVKSKKGGHGTYAPLPDVVESVRPILNKHGIAIVQLATAGPEGGITLRTMLLHESGQRISDDGLYLPAPKLDPQGFGSAHSYARRYSLLAILGVATDDDDGEGALRAFAAPLSEEQAATLVELSEQAGVDAAVAKRRIAQIRAVDYDKSLGALQQRIAEQGAKA